MKCSDLLHYKKVLKRTPFAAPARRASSRLALSFALSLGVALCAGAQVPNPNDTTVPTPYSWPNVHAGGAAPGPSIQGGTNFIPNGLANFLLGTPTAILNGRFDQVSSFLLGNHDPTTPPGASDVLNPNNFRDAVPFNLSEIESPFVFTIPQPADTTLLTVDDGPTPPGPNYTEPLGTWTTVLNDAIATNNEYRTTGVVLDNGNTPDLPPGVTTPQPLNNGATAEAQWTLTAPAASGTSPGSGFYVVTVHLPDTTAVPNDGSTPIVPAQVPISDAHYIVQDTTATRTVLANVRISQTESNANEFLAGPFFLTAGQTITVTLDNTTLVPDSVATGEVIAELLLAAAGLRVERGKHADDDQRDGVP